MSAQSSGIARIPPVRWAIRHPRIAAWIVLSVGMIILLAIEAREVGLLPTQWLALFIACILVAGACVWIISWEGDDEEEDVVDGDPVKVVAPPAPPVSNVETVTPPDEKTVP